MRCKLVNYRARNYPKREQLLVLDILDEDFAAAYDLWKGEPVEVKIKPFWRKRSKDANAYAWVLINRIADALRLPPWEVYREAIREIPGVSEVVAVRDTAVGKLREGWGHNGIGWQSRILGPSDAAGFTDVVLFYGSSSFDVHQMGALLEHLIAEAREMNIETATPETIEKYKYYWAQAENERRAR